MSQAVATHLHASARIELRNALLELAHRLAHLAKQQEEALQVVDKEEEGEETRSPIQQAPADILHHIFAFCLSDNELTIDDPNHPVVILSHVCKSWRELILGHSTYWSNVRILTPPTPISEEEPIDIDIDAGQPVKRSEYHDKFLLWAAKMQRICTAARAFIARSGECPLTITFHKENCAEGAHESSHYNVYLDAYLALVKVLCSPSRRWERCSFDIAYCNCVARELSPIVNLKPEDVPMLTHLEWKAGNIRPWIDEGGIYRGPSLRTLRLLSNGDHGAWSNISVNWSTLTELYYEGFTNDEFLEETRRLVQQYFGARSALSLLKRCPSLVKCGLVVVRPADRSDRGQDYPEEEDLVQSPIELSHLRSLSIQGELFSGELFDALCLPSLQELHLLDVRVPDLNIIWPWIHKYGDVIVSLSVVLQDLPLEDALKLLACVPGLRSLKITIERIRGFYDARGAAAAILDSLTPQVDLEDGGGLTKMCLCPGLTRFGASEGCNVFRDADIVNFVKARRSPMLGRYGVNPIEEVEVEFGRLEGVDIRGLLMEEGVDMEGFSLKVSYEDPVLDYDGYNSYEEEEEDALDDDDED